MVKVPTVLESCFSPVLFSSNARPVLADGEVECLSQNQIAVDFGDKGDKGVPSAVVLTTLRVLLITDEKRQRRGSGLSLALVTSAESKSAIFGSSKIIINVRKPGPTTQAVGVMRLSFSDSGRDAFYERLQSVLKSKAWIPVPSSDKLVSQKTAFSTTSAGVGGIIRRAEEKDRQTDQSLAVAFKDLDALMEKGREMVALAERFKATAMASATSAEDAQFGRVLLDLGIPSPVTRQTAGDAYHSELARQLADFLTVPVISAGGMLNLIDAFCLVNRARGTELLSPDDMYKVCSLFEPLKLSVRLRKFDDNVLVLHSLSRSEEEIGKAMSALVTERGALTAVDAAIALQIALSLANHQLLMAEQKGLVARDDSMDGLRFFPNRLASFL